MTARTSLSALFAAGLLLTGSVAFSATGAGMDPTPSEALEKLQSGNARYLSGARNSPDVSPARRGATSRNGQHPYAVVLSCSDSRVPPEHIFQAGLGDLFVVRVAGNVAGDDEIGSVEYGVDRLGAPLLVVLGHSDCDAVTSVLKGDAVAGASPEIAAKILPAATKAKALYGEVVTPVLLKTAIELNVWQSVEDILVKSRTVRDLVKAGKLRVIAAVYDLETGRVEFLGEHPRQEALLNSVHSAEVTAGNGNVDQQNATGVTFTPRPEPTGYTGNDGKLIPPAGPSKTLTAVSNNAAATKNLGATNAVSVPFKPVKVEPGLVFRFDGPNGLLTSPRVPLHVTLFMDAPEGAGSCDVAVYARRLGYHRSLVSRDLVFHVPTVFVRNGRAQTQFYWMAKNTEKKILDADRYILQAEVTFFSPKGRVIQTLVHQPSPKWDWVVTVK
jgi:carbonic anhydrase